MGDWHRMHYSLIKLPSLFNVEYPTEIMDESMELEIAERQFEQKLAEKDKQLEAKEIEIQQVKQQILSLQAQLSAIKTASMI